jgi:CheY-like chemotaxis protein
MPPEFSILLIHDDPEKARRIQRILIEANLPHRLTAIEDGERLQEPSDPPDLILIDLVQIEARPILTEIKNHPTLSQVPVIVLNLGQKNPVEPTRLRNLILTLQAFWQESAIPNAY